MKKNIITEVIKGSICDELGIEKGDALVEINSSPVNDVFDYRFLITDVYIDLLIEKKSGEQWLLEIEKDETEDLGILFEMPMMDKATSCRNNCIFCFIDQLPKGLRKTLYFKDDDSRLSFLQGNYVTLTNMSKEELGRIAYYKMSPINVSVHTTNGQLRKKMLGNKNAGIIMEQLQTLSEAGISINCQVVLVKGVNDGNELSGTLKCLYEIKRVNSVSVVPVGLTKYRESLFSIEPFNAEDSAEVISLIERIQSTAFLEKGNRFVYAADEFYIKAKKELPPFENYDEFPQLENGVGMMRLFEREFNEEFENLITDNKHRKVSIVTGKSAYDFICTLVDRLKQKFINLHVRVIAVENAFFGENVTVSGLITGKEIIDALRNEKIRGKVLLPSNCFKADEDVFLDNITLVEVCEFAGVSAVRTPVNGSHFIYEIIETTE